jgi:hypothetical protein
VRASGAPTALRVTPRDLAAVEHAPACDVRTSGRERLLDDVGVDRALAAVVSLARLIPGVGC